MLNSKIFIIALLIGLAYYLGAWLGVNHTITPEGIAVLWPANAVVLAAFLILPRRYWPPIAAAVLVAEIVADLPVFPLWAAIAFGVINLSEAALAALLIRRVATEPFDFASLKNGGAFLLFGPLLASTLTGLMGASVYLLLARADSGFLVLWHLWWFGDALGLVLLTPLLVALYRWLEKGPPPFRQAVVVEVAVLWGLVILVGLFAFRSGAADELAYFVKPAWLAPLAIIAAVRLGVAGTAATVTLIATITLWHLINGIHPYPQVTPQYAVWMTQQYLAAIALVALGVAMLMREFRDQRDALRRNEQSLQRSNLELEKRVRERTRELERVNHALEDANRKLKIIAATDELTGIANRRQIYAQAGRKLERLRREGGTACAIMIDLDHFKRINDTLGHNAGDRVLIAIQAPVAESLRPTDLVGRVGGEEFLVLLSDLTLDVAVKVAERIRATIETAGVEYGGDTITLTASLGVARWDGRSDLDALVYWADQALYKAKEKGRNRVEAVVQESRVEQ